MDITGLTICIDGDITGFNNTVKQAEEGIQKLNNAGVLAYEERKRISEKWLKDMERYHGLSVDDYISGLKRMENYTEEYYTKGRIGYKTYSGSMEDIKHAVIENTREKNAYEYANWENDADTWERMRNTFGDWDRHGDSEIDFYGRKLDKIKSFYNAGKISFEQYTNDTNSAKMGLFEAYEAEYDRALSKYAEKIEALQAVFSKQEKTLKESWEVSDRETNMSDLKEQISFYKNSVTETGRNKLKELQTELRDEERSQQMYELQKKNNAVIEAVQARY